MSFKSHRQRKKSDQQKKNPQRHKLSSYNQEGVNIKLGKFAFRLEWRDGV